MINKNPTLYAEWGDELQSRLSAYGCKILWSSLFTENLSFIISPFTVFTPPCCYFTGNEAKIYFFLWQVQSNSFSIEETIHSGKWIALFNVWICKQLRTLFLIIVYSVTYSSILIHLLSRSTLLHYHASLTSELKAPL